MGETNFDVVRANAFIGLGGLTTQGKVWHVKPRTGNDGNSGLSSERAVATLAKAHTLATADQNDIVLLYAEDNSASGTTDYQSATLTWSKDLVHLIGVCSPVRQSNRARIAQLSTATAVSPLVDVTASGCYFKNFSIFQGVNDATSLIALRVTGERNAFEDMHIAGMGNATQVAAGGTSLKIDGGAENVFRNCTIGLDTIGRDATTEGEIWLDGDATRNIFEDCLISAFISDIAYEHVVLEDATAIDRYVLFNNCLFYSISANNATPQDRIFEFKVDLTQGHVILTGGTGYATDDASCVWSNGTEGSIRNTAPTSSTAAVGGLGTIV